MNAQQHLIQSVSIIGGFLEGIDLNFVPGLNCIIGQRGAGKTTMLELIRYALGLKPRSSADEQRLRKLVRCNLDGGRVDVGFETVDGFDYVSSRPAGETPILLKPDRQPAQARMASELFGIDVFSQNQIEQIADQPDAQLQLIDGFESEQIDQITQSISHQQTTLSDVSSRLVTIGERIAILSDEVAALPAIDEKLARYSGGENQETDVVNKAHTTKALRDREARILNTTRTRITELGRKVKSCTGEFEQHLVTLVTDEACCGPNENEFAAVRQTLNDNARRFEAALQTALTELRVCSERVGELQAQVEVAHVRQEQDFQQTLRQHKAAQGEAADRAALDRRRNELLEKNTERERLHEERDRLNLERQTLLTRLSELYDDRFQIRYATVAELNATFHPTIRICIEQNGGDTEYHRLLEHELQGCRLKQSLVADKLSAAFSPTELSEVLEPGDIGPLLDPRELNEQQAQRVLATLSAPKVRYRIEAAELDDLVRIELKDGDAYKDSASLSTGQKCTAILPILLQKSDRPLLIDQPEDNLDNRFIFETVVDTIHRVKTQRQLIFVTHNPNIPVLGNAERVFVLDSDGQRSRLAKAGSVDDCKDQIVTLLEGGVEAFRQRMERYAC